MDDDRIPTDVWVTAHIRQCATKGVPVYVVHKGALAGGTVMVKIVMKGACRLLNQARDIDGRLGWMHVFDEENVDEKKADDYIRRAIQRDPDVWVVEVEDMGGVNPFDPSSLPPRGRG